VGVRAGTIPVKTGFLRSYQRSAEDQHHHRLAPRRRDGQSCHYPWFSFLI